MDGHDDKALHKWQTPSVKNAENGWSTRCHFSPPNHQPNLFNEEEKSMLYRTSVSAPVFGLRREIDRLFEDTFGRSDGVNGWTPAVDVRETEKELRLDVEIPGIKPEEVELTAENGVLMVRGEKRAERKEGDEESRFHIIERSYGSFMRSFQLPQGLDESKIEADYANGVLSIRIPKAALPQPRKIQIGTKNQPAGENAKLN
jgi:HSP20 family protein